MCMLTSIKLGQLFISLEKSGKGCASERDATDLSSATSFARGTSSTVLERKVDLLLLVLSSVIRRYEYIA